MNKLIVFLIISIQLILFSQTTMVTFVEGVDGYSGTSDTYVDIHNSDSSFSASTNLVWDNDPSEKKAFIRFDSLFISQNGQIPDNAYIVSATLSYYVNNIGNTARVNEVATFWNDSLTWNKFDFENDIGSFIGNTENSILNSTAILDVTSSLSSWAANPLLNNGWILQSTGWDGVYVYSSERSVINQRPKLTVIYSVNYPPSQPTLVYPGDNSTEAPYSPSLRVTVTDPEVDNLDVRYFFRPKYIETNFTIIGMPDTQHYTDNARNDQSLYNPNDQYLYDQTAWAVANKDALNIAFISQYGDCVQHATNNSEWQIVDAAWTTVEDSMTTGLADGIPYGLNVGNQDQDPAYGGNTASTAKYNEYFGVSRFAGREYYGGHYGTDNNNHFQLITASGMDFIIVNLEFDESPLQTVIDWADSLLTTYSNRRAILVSHYLIDADNDFPPNAFGLQGQIIYDKLKDHDNLFLMLSGHILGEGRRSDEYNGHTIHTLLSNYQDYSNGGNGFLRIMEFRPSENKIFVSTYSPSLDQYERDSNSEFVLDYNMGASAWLEIGNLSNVNSGETAVWDHTGLLPDTEYEWYIEVTDGNNTVTSPVWTFKTEPEDIGLPVFLSSFTAKKVDLGIKLEWIVESEIDNLGFIIEKSSNDKNGEFHEIASYKNSDKLLGRGNTGERKIYNYLDTDYQRGQTYFYQLADVSISGKITYHVVFEIHVSPTPEKFKLYQNFPNPFNPSTIIRYQLPEARRVKIVIFNLLGQSVWEKEFDKQGEGHHEVEIDFSNFSSGVYFYRIEGGSFVQTKKMVLLK